MPNNTQYAGHFRKATEILLDGMANPAGPTFVSAQYEARQAINAAFPGAEKQAGQTLYELINDVSKIYGFSA